MHPLEFQAFVATSKKAHVAVRGKFEKIRDNNKITVHNIPLQVMLEGQDPVPFFGRTISIGVERLDTFSTCPLACSSIVCTFDRNPPLQRVVKFNFKLRKKINTQQN